MPDCHHIWSTAELSAGCFFWNGAARSPRSTQVSSLLHGMEAKQDGPNDWIVASDIVESGSSEPGHAEPVAHLGCAFGKW